MFWTHESGADTPRRLGFTLRFSLSGISIGFLVGVCEGCFLFLNQPLINHGVGRGILFLAPLVDSLAFGFLGVILGLAADSFSRMSPFKVHHLITLGLGIAGAYLSYSLAHALIHSNKFPRSATGGFGLLGGVIIAIAVQRYRPTVSSGFARIHAQFCSSFKTFIRQCAIFVGAVCIGWVTACWIVRVPEPRSDARAEALRGSRPNIVMIALDTARADYISSYGYNRPTTPNLDSLASKGALFETAVAPAPWTLPTFATVFTGLLPHQNQASLEAPLPKGLVTLASILSSRGYLTAGFNANYHLGTARTGLAQGFDHYDDDDGSFRTDLASIGFVKIFWLLAYYPFIRADYLERRDARTLNQAVLRWLGSLENQPFFLFVNYFDPHEPYSTIPEIGNRFGNAQRTLAQRIRAEFDGLLWEIEAPRTPEERAALIAGYDSGLAFADSQIGVLLHRLESSPEWSNTYVIVFGDHGQAFGTHRHYGHGWGLNWELLHVPLIIAGPGVPKGRRVKDLVSLQQLFATVLDLSGGEGGAPTRNSLRCLWTNPPNKSDWDSMVVSELGPMPDPHADSPSISLVTPKWHLIRDAADNLQLYDLTTDPGEDVNLAGLPQYQKEVATLQGSLIERVLASSPPWLGEDCLWALGEREFSRMAAMHIVRTNWPSMKFQRPSSQENELLHSLPYQ